MICAINLQSLSSLLNHTSTWTFSLTNDSSTHYDRSYFDNRIHIYVDGILYNFHTLAIPMFEQHIVDNMFKLVTQFLDVICPFWRMKFIDLGSDGANTMTGRFHGVVTQLERQAQYKVYRT